MFILSIYLYTYVIIIYKFYIWGYQVYFLQSNMKWTYCNAITFSYLATSVMVGCGRNQGGYDSIHLHTPRPLTEQIRFLKNKKNYKYMTFFIEPTPMPDKIN